MASAIGELGKQRRTGPRPERRRLPLFSLIVIAVVLLLALFPSLFAPHDPDVGNLYQRLIPPGQSFVHPLGTDSFGRDEMSRIIYGARFTLLIVLTALSLAGTVGTIVGMLAGYAGGWLDAVLMRIVDAVLSVPLFLVALVLAVTRGPSAAGVVLVIGGLLWAQYARVVRAQTVLVAQEEFIEAARVVGVPLRRILLRHIFPNVLPALIVLLTSQAGSVVILAASLDFLGAGVPPPAPEWGTLVADGRGVLLGAWWVSVLPGLAIVGTVLAFNFLGDWLQETMDVSLTS